MVSTPSFHVLVIDDEPTTLHILRATLQRGGHTVSTVSGGREALMRLAQGDVDVAVCDMVLPDRSGIEVMQAARQQSVDTAFLMMTAFSSMDNAIEAMKAGALDYLIKPLRGDELLQRVAHAGQLRGLKAENETLRRQVRQQQGGTTARLHTQTPAMLALERMVSKVARTDSTVLLTGESGAGKSMIAHDLHRQSARADRPFVAVNCGAIPENLLESELFGHTKGAFTGADKARKGLFLEADQGSIFLDEIGELPLTMQVKLLHVLEAREVRPLGAEQARKVDVRIVAATNRDLPAMVTEGRFREDLYYRLSGFHLQVPPLRERGADIPELVAHLLGRVQQRLGQYCAPLRVDDEALAALQAYDWPGNVRELENVLQRAAILADDGWITAADMPDAVLAATARLDAPPSPTTAPAGGAIEATGLGTGTLRQRVRAFELDVIRQVIAHCSGDRRAAAQQLGMGLSSLYRKLEEHDEAS